MPVLRLSFLVPFVKNETALETERTGVIICYFDTKVNNLHFKAVPIYLPAAQSPTSKTAFQLRGLDTAAQATLSRIRLGFARQETRTCPPA